MSPVPERPKIYHIAHVDNLATIVRDGVLLCDATIAARGGPGVTIGMSEIKRRRIEEISVSCHPGTKVGDYVPFYFCPRSVMLYLLHRANLISPITMGRTTLFILKRISMKSWLGLKRVTSLQCRCEVCRNP